MYLETYQFSRNRYFESGKSRGDRRERTLSRVRGNEKPRSELGIKVVVKLSTSVLPLGVQVEILRMPWR